MDLIRIKELSINDRNRLFNRFGTDFTSVLINTVIPIVNDVRERGDDAVREYSRRFDGAILPALNADKSEIEEGYKKLDKKAIEAFEKAISNITEFHEHQLKTGFEYVRNNGVVLGMTYQPLGSAAVYAPGGKASYPSSVLMGVIPAKIAGVKDITLITPVKAEGKISDAVCAVCHLLGITSVLKAGGAQGVAAAAFGTKSVRKAQIIVGPGNIFVTAAKSYLFSLGQIQIDTLAGPSETLIIADENVDPKWVAYDLLSQAEHEENAKAVLIDLSEDHAEKVWIEIEKNLDEGKGRIKIKRKVVADNFKVFIADSIDEAIEFSNDYAPEHMQLMVEDPLQYQSRIRNVGSLFLGYYSPVAAGDYFSGTNHVLPTGGACRFSSGLSVDTFYRRTTYQMLTKEGLTNALEPVNIMSSLEGFDDMHGGSLRVRFEKK
jgi:histidinol dehydrogenase